MAEYQAFLESLNPLDRAGAFPVHWRHERFSGDPLAPVVGVDGKQAWMFAQYLRARYGPEWRLPRAAEVDVIDFEDAYWHTAEIPIGIGRLAVWRLDWWRLAPRYVWHSLVTPPGDIERWDEFAMLEPDVRMIVTDSKCLHGALIRGRGRPFGGHFKPTSSNYVITVGGRGSFDVAMIDVLLRNTVYDMHCAIMGGDPAAAINRLRNRARCASGTPFRDDQTASIAHFMCRASEKLADIIEVGDGGPRIGGADALGGLAISDANGDGFAMLRNVTASTTMLEARASVEALIVGTYRAGLYPADLKVAGFGWSAVIKDDIRAMEAKMQRRRLPSSACERLVVVRDERVVPDAPPYYVCLTAMRPRITR
jgi:hypothetical protein